MPTSDDKPPSMWRAFGALFDMRKTAMFIVMALVTAITTTATRFGLQVDDATLAAYLTPIVLGGLMVIFGIAKEDAAAKAAGAGTTRITTTQPLPKDEGGGTSSVTTIEPDPTGKP